MIKIEAVTLEAAYKDAALQLKCSVTELKIEVVQAPSKGILGLFKKSAIIVAVREVNLESQSESSKTSNLDKRVNPTSNNKSNKTPKVDKREALKPKQVNVNTSNESNKTPKVDKRVNTISSNESNKAPKEDKRVNSTNSNESNKVSKVNKREALNQKLKEDSKKEEQKRRPKKQKSKIQEEKKESHTMLNDTFMPASFVSMQDDEDEYDVSSYLADYDEGDEDCEECKNISEIAKTVSKEINELFDFTCFKIQSIDVRAYDENTLLVEFKGEDAALLIGKEGYRYKALSYMMFNWLNTKYQVQLRLEIAEFLKNQEESISKYLVGVCENINRDGRAQTKILDGVLVQIALNELRDKYPDKYIVIRSTRDGLKYIIINDYHSN